MLRSVVPVLALLVITDAGAAAVASGRNWRLTINKLQCEAGATLVIDTRIEYLGPTVPAETPANELADGEGRQIRPKSLVWKAGSKDLARWLTAGKMANVTTLVSTDVQLKPDGSFSGFVPVRDGRNQVRITALASDGSRGSVTLDLDFGRTQLTDLRSRLLN